MFDISKDFNLSSWDDLDSNQKQINLWCTRILLDLRGIRNKNSRRNIQFDTSEIFQVLKLTPFDDEVDVIDFFDARIAQIASSTEDSKQTLFSHDRDDKFNIEYLSYRAIMQVVKDIKNKLEYAPVHLSRVLQANLDKLSQLVKLNKTEQQILAFFVLAADNNIFSDCIETIGEVNKQVSINYLSIILNISKKKVSQALSYQGLLQQSGLLKDAGRSYRSSRDSLDEKYELLEGLIDILLQENVDILQAMRTFFEKSIPGDLTLKNFEYLSEDTEYITRFLQNLKSDLSVSEQKGVNILIYGKPGVGKTMWVKAMAEHLKMNLFEVTTKDEDDEDMIPEKRLDAYRLSQEVLKASAQQSLILFDECEDIWPVNESGFMGMIFQQPSRAISGKGWMNKMLENNAVPTFWVANTINQIDPAYLRRIDYVIEVPNPPKNVRQGIVMDYMEGLNDIEQPIINSIADNKYLTPANISRVSRVVKHITKTKCIKSTQEKVIHLLNNILDTQGHLHLDINKGMYNTPYDLELLNTDIDIKALLKGLKKTQQGRFCLWGQPGVGKTAFAQHIAQVLDKEVIIKKASDLLDPYVGMTEKKISEAFKQAKKTGAVLQIDEADTFLTDRRQAVRSWEVSQVNELLTQIENFDGIFIASTNLMENFDRASIRRFDLKIHFDYLTNEQVWLMYQKILTSNDILLIEAEEVDIWQVVKSLKQVTPGDFSTILRKIKITGELLTAENLLAYLKSELDFKNNYDDNNSNQLHLVS